MDAVATLDADTLLWREHVTKLACEHAEWRAANLQTLIMDAQTVARSFWEGQTPEEIAAMKHWLADSGQATWAVKGR